MSFLERLITAFTPGAASQVPDVRAFGEGAFFYGLDDPYLAQFVRSGHVTSSGTLINRNTALGNATFFRACSLICSSIGMLPLHLFQEVAAASGDQPAQVEKASGHPLFNILHAKPNGWQTPFDFKTQIQADLLFHGSAFAFQRRNVRGEIQQLIPLQRSRMSWQLTPDFTGLQFFYDHPQKGKTPLSQQEVFWIRAPITNDGINGVALIEVAAEALGLAQAAERAQGSIFRNGSIVGGVLEHPKTLTAPAIERLRNQFEERHSGSLNAGKWIVAEEGLKVSAGPQASGKDAQAVEARRLQVEEIGRITGVPRPLLMMDETSWGTGIELLGLFFITYCLGPWFVAWEEAINRSLLLEREQGTYFAKFNEGALLRGSLKDQAEFFSKALGSGGSPAWMKQNEVREKFNLAAVEGGDELKSGAGAPGAQSGGTNDGTGTGTGDNGAA